MSEILFFRIPVTAEGGESETRIEVRPTSAGLVLVQGQRPTAIEITDIDGGPSVRLSTARGAFIASRVVIAHVMGAG